MLYEISRAIQGRTLLPRSISLNHAERIFKHLAGDAASVDVEHDLLGTLVDSGLSISMAVMHISSSTGIADQ